MVPPPHVIAAQKQRVIERRQELPSRMQEHEVPAQIPTSISNHRHAKPGMIRRDPASLCVPSHHGRASPWKLDNEHGHGHGHVTLKAFGAISSSFSSFPPERSSRLSLRSPCFSPPRFPIFLRCRSDERRGASAATKAEPRPVHGLRRTRFTEPSRVRPDVDQFRFHSVEVMVIGQLHKLTRLNIDQSDTPDSPSDKRPGRNAGMDLELSMPTRPRPDHDLTGTIRMIAHGLNGSPGRRHSQLHTQRVHGSPRASFSLHRATPSHASR